MWKSMNQWSEQPSLVFLRSKTNFHWTYCRCANKRKPSSNSDFCYDYYLENYISAPHSLFQKLRLFLFPLCHAWLQRRERYFYLGKFESSLVYREVIDLETKCVRIIIIIICNNIMNVWFCIGEYFWIIKWHFKKTWKKSGWPKQDSNLWLSIAWLLKWSASEILEIY